MEIKLINRDCIETVIPKCRLLLTGGDMEECVSQFIKAIHSRYDIEKPAITRLIRRKLNTINVMRDKMTDMQRHLDEAHNMMSKLSDEYLSLGDACINEAHEETAAIANYDKAIRLNPTSVKAYIQRGKALESSQSYEALKSYSKAIAMSPTNFEAFYLRGCLRLKLHDGAGAVADLDKATTIDQYHPDAHEKFGDALMMTGREDAANIQWELAERMAKRQRGKNKKK